MAELENVDINSLDDSTTFEVDQDKSIFDMPPPPPDGKYRARVKLKERDGGLWKKGTTKDGAMYLKTEIEARIIAPGTRFDDLPLFDNFVSTMNMPNTPASKVSSLLNEVLGVKTGNRVTHKELAQALTNAVGDGVEVGIVTQWRASVKTGEENGKGVYKDVRGMKRFSQKADGSHDPIIVIEGQEASARAEISRYIPVAKLTEGATN